MELTEQHLFNAAQNNKILISLDGVCSVWYDTVHDRFIARWDDGNSLASIFFGVIQTWIGVYADFMFEEGEYV